MDVFTVEKVQMTKETKKRLNEVKNKHWSIKEKMRYALQIPIEDVENILLAEKKSGKRKLN